MPDLKKSTVVIASVLKPVDDSRMYEKIGYTLSCKGRYTVHIIGCASGTNTDSAIVQHPFRPFPRVSLGRLIAPWRILFKTLRLKPDLFIIGTHELIYLALFLKLTMRCKIIYDVQENYYWNILYTSAFPLLLKPFVALYVRAKEALASRFVDHFFLAEKGYESELTFPGERRTVLENKVRIPVAGRRAPGRVKSKEVIRLLFSGTLAESTGVFTAIDLAVKLHVVDNRFRLTIIGFCAQSAVLRKIQLLIKPRPFIQLIAKDGPVPHSDILAEIKKADFGLITYQINPSTMNSIPTKLYEYLGCQLPILLASHKPWVDFTNPYSAAVVFDYHDIDAVSICKQMMDKFFYPVAPANVYWESEEPRLLRAVEGVLG
jgi:glycosyltransferase involved in cell wall biosynthesis